MRASGVLCAALILLIGTYHFTTRRRLQLRRLQLSSGSVIALKTVTSHKYLTVALVDGLLRVSAYAPADQSFFRVLALPDGTVSALRKAAQSVDIMSESWVGRKVDHCLLPLLAPRGGRSARWVRARRWSPNRAVAAWASRMNMPTAVFATLGRPRHSYRGNACRQG